MLVGSAQQQSPQLPGQQPEAPWVQRPSWLDQVSASIVLQGSVAGFDLISRPRAPHQYQNAVERARPSEK